MRVAAFLEDMGDFFAYSILLAANRVSISPALSYFFPFVATTKKPMRQQ